MHFFKILLVLLSFSGTLFSESEVNDQEDYTAYYPHQICYQFKKNNFTSITNDILVNTVIRDNQVEMIDFSFAPLTGYFHLPYNEFNCTYEKQTHYTCTKQGDTSEKLQYYMEDDFMYIHIDNLKISPDKFSSISFEVKSKDTLFSKGSKVACYPSLETQIMVDGVKKGSREDTLLKSIVLKDIVVHQIVYHKDLAIALGEDNSPEIREVQSMEEDYSSLIIRSSDGGSNWKKVVDNVSIPLEEIIMLDPEHIISWGSIEGGGGSVWVTADGGKNWVNSYDHGMIESLNYNGLEITIVNIIGTVIKSKNGGLTWEEIIVRKKD